MLGGARTCAAVAAGEAIWRPPAELELEALMVAPADVAEVLQALTDWQTLETTGAGPLPIDESSSGD